MYWSLLAEILVTAPPHQKTAYARPAKVWLVPLLNRIPFAPVVSTFFSICMSANHSPSEVLIQLFSRCALVIWPMAVQRTNVDALVDCYSFMLAISPAYSSEDATENNFTKFIVLVTSSFRSAFSNTTNKKKVVLEPCYSHRCLTRAIHSFALRSFKITCCLGCSAFPPWLLALYRPMFQINRHRHYTLKSTSRELMSYSHSRH